MIQQLSAPELKAMIDRGEPFEIGITGWVADYPDAFDLIHVLFDGRTIGPTGNHDV